jgi:arylesterase/paraoxonase
MQAIAQVFLKTKSTNVVYCHVDEGCKIAVDKLTGSNGLVRPPGTDMFYLADQFFPVIRVLERQTDNTLVVTDEVHTGI